MFPNLVASEPRYFRTSEYPKKETLQYVQSPCELILLNTFSTYGLAELILQVFVSICHRGQLTR